MRTPLHAIVLPVSFFSLLPWVFFAVVVVPPFPSLPPRPPRARALSQSLSLIPIISLLNECPPPPPHTHTHTDPVRRKETYRT